MSRFFISGVVAFAGVVLKNGLLATSAFTAPVGVSGIPRLFPGMGAVSIFLFGVAAGLDRLLRLTVTKGDFSLGRFVSGVSGNISESSDDSGMMEKMLGRKRMPELRRDFLSSFTTD